MNKLVVSMVGNATAIATSDGDAASIIKCIQNGKWGGPIEKVRTTFSRVQHETGDQKAAKVAVGPPRWRRRATGRPQICLSF